jgi:hypothetical protein
MCRPSWEEANLLNIFFGQLEVNENGNIKKTYNYVKLWRINMSKHKNYKLLDKREG